MRPLTDFNTATGGEWNGGGAKADTWNDGGGPDSWNDGGDTGGFDNDAAFAGGADAATNGVAADGEEFKCRR